MDYGALVRDAWRITWRHKYLWLLGFLAGEAGGCGISYNIGDIDPTRFDSVVPESTFNRTESWLNAHWEIVILIIAGFFLLGLVLLVVSLIARGGLIAGVDEISRGGRPTLGRAWGAGVRRFWRLLGMYLLIGVTIFVVIGLVLAAIIVPLVIWASSDAQPGPAWIVLLVMLVLLLALLAIPVALGVQLVTTWGTRSLVLDQTGIVESLGAGWRLLRRRLGTSILLLLLSLVIGLAVAMLIGIAVAAIAIPVGIGAVASDADAGLLWGGITLLGLVLLAATVIGSAITGTFFSAYWTLAYRRLLTPPAPPAMASTWGTTPYPPPYGPPSYPPPPAGPGVGWQQPGPPPQPPKGSPPPQT
jgi:hypothetical protein